MKFILSTAGTAAIRVSGDNVVPTHGVLARDIIEFIAQEYQFSVKPTFPSGVPPFAITTHTYQSGVFMDNNGGRFPIIQLSVVLNGDIVTAGTTNIAENIIEDLTSKLDTSMGYRFASASKRKIFHSMIVAQFDPAVEDKLKSLGKIEKIINDNVPRPAMPFKIKRLAFGYGDVAQFFMPTSLEAIESADFLIERRTSEPYAENRYFSSAPVETSEHIRILEQIEEALG